MVNYVKMGKRIAEIRKHKGITQETLAEKTGVCPQYLSRIECGKCKPSLETMVNIVNALNCTLDEVICDSVNADFNIIQSETNNIFSNCTADEASLLSEQLKSLYGFIQEARMLNKG